MIDGLPGRPLLRQRLAHHRRDGRRLDAAAEARRRRLVRHRRRVGRAGDEVLQRLGLHALSTCPTPAACTLQRTDFAPDADRAALFGLQMTNPAQRPATVTVKVDAHSELMGAYPWGFSGVTPNASDNLADHGEFTGGALQFTDDGALPGAPEHHYAALVASNQHAGLRRGGRRPAARYRGPQPGNVCAGDDGTVAAERVRRRPVRQGHRRRAALRRDHPAPAARRRCGSPSAGSDKGLAAAQQRAGRRAAGPGRRARAPRSPRATSCSRWSQVSLPGDRLLQNADRLGQAEPRRPHADRLGPADPLDQPGQAVPGAARAPSRTPAGSAPASPTTRGSSPPTASTRTSPRWRSASSTPPRTTCARCATSPRSSTTAPGIVVHEAVSDGSIWFGHDSQTTRTRRRNDFNTDETVKFPSTVALDLALDRRRPLPRRDVRLRQAQPAGRRPTSSTSTATAGPRARATSSARAWARRSSTTASTTSARSTTSPTWRASKHDDATVAWATSLRRQAAAAVRGRRGGTPPAAVRRLAGRPGQHRSRSRSTGSARCRWRPSSTTRRQVDARRGRRTTTGRPRSPARENSVLQRRPARQPRALPHRLRRRPRGPGRVRIFSLTTSIQAVGEGNYGRLGRRPAAALHPRQRRDDVLRARHGRHPGRAARRDAGDLPVGLDGDLSTASRRTSTAAGPAGRWSCRRGATTAPPGRSCTSSSACGPSSTAARLEVVPQVPGGQPRVAGSTIRLGRSGSVAVFASHDGATYTHARASARRSRSSPSATRCRRARRSRGEARRHGPSRPRRAHQPRARGHGGSPAPGPIRWWSPAASSARAARRARSSASTSPPSRMAMLAR